MYDTDTQRLPVSGYAADRPVHDRRTIGRCKFRLPKLGIDNGTKNRFPTVVRTRIYSRRRVEKVRNVWRSKVSRKNRLASDRSSSLFSTTEKKKLPNFN